MKNEAIEMIKMPVSVVRVAAFCLPLVLVASCGTGSSEALQGSTINIDPAALAQTTTPTAGAALVQELFTIEVRSPTGYPQVGVQVVIETDGNMYTVDTSTTPYTYTLLIPNPVTGGTSYTTNTAANGVVTVAIDFAVGPGTAGEITVISARSGTAYNRTNVTYTCKAVAPATC